MKDMGIIQCSEAQAKELIINKDTAYVHSNIEKIEKTDEMGNAVDNLYSCNEIQYTKDEYIELLANQNNELENENLNIQLALVALYKNM